MTRRKPPGRTWDSWIEQQIREAEAEGAFDDLPGKGKPQAGLKGVYDPDWWIKQIVRRERLSLLPPALAIRKKVETELARVMTLRRERDVRKALDVLNAEIAKTNARAAEGPATDVPPLDVESQVQRWRERAAD